MLYNECGKVGALFLVVSHLFCTSGINVTSIPDVQSMTSQNFTKILQETLEIRNITESPEVSKLFYTSIQNFTTFESSTQQINSSSSNFTEYIPKNKPESLEISDITESPAVPKLFYTSIQNTTTFQQSTLQFNSSSSNFTEYIPKIQQESVEIVNITESPAVPKLFYTSIQTTQQSNSSSSNFTEYIAKSMPETLKIRSITESPVVPKLSNTSIQNSTYFQQSTQQFNSSSSNSTEYIPNINQETVEIMNITESPAVPKLFNTSVQNSTNFQQFNSNSSNSTEYAPKIHQETVEIMNITESPAVPKLSDTSIQNSTYFQQSSSSNLTKHIPEFDQKTIEIRQFPAVPKLLYTKPVTPNALQINTNPIDFYNKGHLYFNYDVINFLQKNLNFKQPCPGKCQLISTDYLNLRLMIAIQLNDNLIKLFGYIYYQTEYFINWSVREAVKEIYNGFRKRIISTADLIVFNTELYQNNLMNQLWHVIKNMEHAVPVNLLGSVLIIEDALIHNLLNIRYDMKTIFEGINFKEFQILVNFKEVENSNVFIKTIEANWYWHKILFLWSNNQVHFNHVTLSLAILSLPVTITDPQIEENLELLVELLMKNKNHLNFLIDHNFPKKQKTSLRKVCLHVLHELLHQHSVDKQLKAIAETLNIRLQNMYEIDAENQYRNLILHNNLDVIYLLEKYFPHHLYSSLVLRNKNQLVKSITNGTININHILSTFNKFKYSNELDLLLAILYKIQSALKTKENLNLLIDYLKIKTAAKDDIPLTNIDLNFLFSTVSEATGLKSLVDSIKNYIKQKRINYKPIINSIVESGFNYNPKQLLVMFLEKLVGLESGFHLKHEMEKKVKKLLSVFNKIDEIDMKCAEKCVNEEKL